VGEKGDQTLHCSSHNHRQRVDGRGEFLLQRREGRVGRTGGGRENFRRAVGGGNEDLATAAEFSFALRRSPVRFGTASGGHFQCSWSSNSPCPGEPEYFDSISAVE